LRSYDSAPCHPILPSASYLSFSVVLCVVGPAYWRGEEGGGGRGAESYDRKKAWPSINRSIISDHRSANPLTHLLSCPHSKLLYSCSIAHIALCSILVLQSNCYLLAPQSKHLYSCALIQTLYSCVQIQTA
jgi:hypothetical protein